MVLRGLLLLLGLLVLWGLLLLRRLLLLRSLPLIGLVLWGFLLGLVLRSLLLVRGTEETQEAEPSQLQQDQNQQDHDQDQKTDYQPGSPAAPVSSPPAFLVHSPIVDDDEKSRNPL